MFYLRSGLSFFPTLLKVQGKHDFVIRSSLYPTYAELLLSNYLQFFPCRVKSQPFRHLWLLRERTHHLWQYQMINSVSSSLFDSVSHAFGFIPRYVTL